MIPANSAKWRLPNFKFRIFENIQDFNRNSGLTSLNPSSQKSRSRFHRHLLIHPHHRRIIIHRKLHQGIPTKSINPPNRNIPDFVLDPFHCLSSNGFVRKISDIILAAATAISPFLRRDGQFHAAKIYFIVIHILDGPHQVIDAVSMDQ